MRKKRDEQKQKPLVGHRKLVKQGGSVYISLPPAWLESHGIDPDKDDELLTIANSDIRIVNPKKERELYKKVTKLVEAGEYEIEEEKVSKK